MADYTNLKQQIAAAIRANGEGAITGPLLQEQLLDIVDAMEVDTWGGLITEDTVPPTDIDKPHVFLAITEGTYEAFDLTVEEGDVWLVYRDAGDVEEVVDPETEEVTEVPTWTKVNLTADLKDRIEALEEGTQATLTPGDGIDIDEQGNISVKTGNGLVVNDEGEIEVETTDEPQTYPTLPVSGKGMTDYIDTEKGLTIAELDANGKVKSEQMPNDVAYFAEESIDPDDPAYHDEYERVLAKMYQDLDNWDAMSSQVRHATQRANQAAENAEGKGNQALASSERAQYYATRAENMANQAETARNNANASAANADRAAGSVATVIEEANGAISLANSAAEAASAAADEAEAAKTAANTAAGAAATAATNAENKGTYAKNQGDAAKEIVDGSKGDYDSLNARLNAIETGKQDAISDLSTIRIGAAAGATAYQLPVGGVPKTTLAPGVQTSLGKADTAYQLPQTGIPQSDLADAVQAKLDNGIGYTEGVDWNNM